MHQENKHSNMSIQFTDKEFTNLNVWITKVSQSYHNLSPESKLAFNEIFDLLYNKYKECNSGGSLEIDTVEKLS